MSPSRGIITLGIDLGGTKVATALVDETGCILAHQYRLTHPENGAENVIADIVACARDCFVQGDESVQGIGIGVAGQVDRAGTVSFSPNLGWYNVPLKAKLEESLNMPVVITNDVRAATFGEWRRGAGQGVSDLVCLFIGTGIGGGIVSGGQLLEGCRNSAGELGHLTIVKDGRRCRCPNRGCLEAYAGGWAIAERAQEAIRADPKAGRRLVSLAETIPQISAATVSRASQDGDSLSIRLMAETVQYLVAGIVSIANIFNPCLLVLGGSVTLGLTAYLAAIKSAVQETALPSAGKSLNIVTTALGDKAGVIGAASLVQEQFK